MGWDSYVGVCLEVFLDVVLEPPLFLKVEALRCKWLGDFEL